MKQETKHMRKVVANQERLAVTLKFLVSGDNFTCSLSYSFKFSKQAILNIVHEVCYAVINVLKDEIKLICFLYYLIPIILYDIYNTVLYT